ncbi:PAS domain S-box protein (macronuclear) [Tetrahymena thermophila SB210]|uniref:PAS domain S-box protein n=1 Tax=Tetrahymena thermophila (strain SB210) TaxID=312017 RepID=W7XGH5_TETTS|nr:PAS domain S-box protein [Tetrahymena thermophila SB210]EWS72004.1 PAS domain S-box protein [Tetrahymena thermophila SB210]|eukprot:XP_012655460.1 PAS domain S-box protein [Tetrahymena thermophila SB210]
MLKNLKKEIYLYYISDFGRQQYAYLRGQLLSLLLIVICNVQSTSIQLTSNLLDKIASENINESNDSQSVYVFASIAHYFRIYPLIGAIFGQYSEKKILFAFIIIAAIFNSLILLSQIFRFFLFKYKLTNNNFAKLFDIINSFILKVYVFVFYFPFNTACFQAIFSSDSSLTEIIFSIITLLMTLLISFVQNWHDFSFSFVLDDYMASTDTHSKQLELILNIILVIAFSASKYINQNVIAALHITFVSTKISLQIIELVYYDNLIIQTHLQFKFIHAFNAIIFCLSFNFPHMFNGTQLLVSILLTLPFSYIMAKYLLFHRISDLALRKKNYTTLEQINLHIRTAFFMVKHLEMHDYTDLRRSVLYESIYQNHYYTCSRKDCFCEQLIREDGFSWEELQGFAYRDQFISQYFAQMYSDYLNKIKATKQQQIKEYNQTCFNYLTFLIEVVNVPTSALVEVVQISNIEKKTASIKDQMVYQQIYDHGEKIFYNFFNNPTIYNQKLQLNKVLEFDQLFLNTQQSLKQSLILLRGMLINLCKEHVDISKINEQVLKIKDLKEQIQQTIQKMYSYNPYSSRCQQLAEIFSKCLDLHNKKPQQYQKEAIYWNRKHQNMQTNIDKEVPIFSQEACVVYISLIQPIGIIKNASYSVQSMFGYTSQELLNKNCNVLIPDQLKLVHDKILNRFVTSGQMNGINAGQLQVFGINQNGFAIPVNLRIRLDQSQADDFGASAFFTYQNNQSSEFIVFSQQGNISNFTKKIYVDLFSGIISEAELNLCQRLDLFKILPILQNHFQQMSKGQTLTIEHNSILISPINEKGFKALCYQSNKPFNSIYDFLSLCKKLNNKDFKFHSVTFKAGKLQTSYKGFGLGYIQVDNLQLLKKKSEIKAHLKDISIQFDKIKQYLELDQDIQNLNNSTSLTNLQAAPQKTPIISSQNLKLDQNAVKNILSPKVVTNTKRQSFSTQTSRKSLFGIQKNLSPFDFGSCEDHAEALNQKEPTHNQFTFNHLLNTNRKLLNGQQDKCLNNHEMLTDQSVEYQANFISSPMSSRNYYQHNTLVESKLFQSNNEAIFEAEEQDDYQDNPADILENMFSTKSEVEETQQDNSFNYEVPQNQTKNFNKLDKYQKTQYKYQNKADLQSFSQNQIGKCSKNKNNTKNQSQQMNGLVNNDQNQSSSVNSTMSEFHTLKLTLLRAISRNHKNKALRFLYFTGFFKIIVLIILATFLYTYQYSTLNYINILNQNLVKGYEIMNEFVSIIAHTEYIKMYNKGIIQNTLQQSQLHAVLAEPLVIQQQFKDTVSDLENYDSETWYGQYIRSQQQQIIVFNQRNISSTMDLKMIFSFVSMAENLYMYSQQQTETSLRYIHYNQKDNIRIFQNMADLQKQEMDSEINTIKSFQVTQIIVLEIFTLLMAIQVIPIYYYIQYKKEQILKLFCTFQPNQLVERIEAIEYYASKEVLSNNQDQIFTVQDTHSMKKRTISSTNELQKMNIKMLSIVLIIFCFYSIYPIINYTISNKFIDEYSFTSNELSLIYSFRGKAPLILAFNFLRQTATYEQRPDIILQGLDEQIEITQNYISNTTNKIVQSLKDSSNQNLIYDQTLHRSIVETSMNQDICSPLQNYQKNYLDNQYQIDLSDCSTIQNGIWNKGYLLGLQSLINTLIDFQQLYKVSQTNDEFISSLQSYYKEYNGEQYIKVYQYIRIVPLLIGKFIIDETNQFFNLYSSYSLGIFSFIVIVASITFLILWNLYYRYLVNSFYDTRQIYNLFPYEFIYQNPYMYNYVKKEYSI